MEAAVPAALYSPSVTIPPKAWSDISRVSPWHAVPELTSDQFNDIATSNVTSKEGVPGSPATNVRQAAAALVYRASNTDSMINRLIYQRFAATTCTLYPSKTPQFPPSPVRVRAGPLTLHCVSECPKTKTLLSVGKPLDVQAMPPNDMTTLMWHSTSKSVLRWLRPVIVNDVITSVDIPDFYPIFLFGVWRVRNRHTWLFHLCVGALLRKVLVGQTIKRGGPLSVQCLVPPNSEYLVSDVITPYTNYPLLFTFELVINGSNEFAIGPTKIGIAYASLLNYVTTSSNLLSAPGAGVRLGLWADAMYQTLSTPSRVTLPLSSHIPPGVIPFLVLLQTYVEHNLVEYDTIEIASLTSSESPTLVNVDARSISCGETAYRISILLASVWSHRGIRRPFFERRFWERNVAPILYRPWMNSTDYDTVFDGFRRFMMELQNQCFANLSAAQKRPYIVVAARILAWEECFNAFPLVYGQIDSGGSHSQMLLPKINNADLVSPVHREITVDKESGVLRLPPNIMYFAHANVKEVNYGINLLDSDIRLFTAFPLSDMVAGTVPAVGCRLGIEKGAHEYGSNKIGDIGMSLNVGGVYTTRHATPVYGIHVWTPIQPSNHPELYRSIPNNYYTRLGVLGQIDLRAIKSAIIGNKTLVCLVPSAVTINSKCHIFQLIDAAAHQLFFALPELLTVTSMVPTAGHSFSPFAALIAGAFQTQKYMQRLCVLLQILTSDCIAPWINSNLQGRTKLDTFTFGLPPSPAKDIDHQRRAMKSGSETALIPVPEPEAPGVEVPVPTPTQTQTSDTSSLPPEILFVEDLPQVEAGVDTWEAEPPATGDSPLPPLDIAPLTTTGDVTPAATQPIETSSQGVVPMELTPMYEGMQLPGDSGSFTPTFSSFDY